MGPSGALTTPKLSEPKQVIFEKPNATQIESESETHQRCSYDMEFTVKGIESASYAVLLSELKSHTDNGCPLKCRKDTLTMQDVLRQHYIEAHGAGVTRGVERKSTQILV